MYAIKSNPVDTPLPRLLIILLILPALLLSCSSHNAHREYPERAPAIEDKTTLELVKDNTDFAIDLYNSIRINKGNILVSPYSISVGIAMAYAGARGETEQQISDTLHFTLEQGALHPAVSGLNKILDSRNLNPMADKKKVRLDIANSLWVQSEFPILPSFTELIKTNYGTGLRFIDFSNEPDESSATINEWVKENTGGKIDAAIPPDYFRRHVIVLAIVNAIYFDASWYFPFDEELTRDDRFHLLDGTDISVFMMHQVEEHGYYRGDIYKLGEFIYESGNLAMDIFLPDMGSFEEFEKHLTAAGVGEMLDKIETREMELALPKFEFRAKFRLKETLSQMGMPIAFNEGLADLSGTTAGGGIWIDEVFHETYIKVDEKGTVAAAATIAMEETGEDGGPVMFIVDRPFIYLIRDIPSGTILFMGRVLDPSMKASDDSSANHIGRYSIYPPGG